MIKSFKKFINYVEENYHSSFTEDDIKNITGYSYQYFNKCFKEIWHMTPQVYRKRRQLTLIALEIKRNTVTIKESDLAPWTDDSAFLKAFKREFNITPHKYIKEKDFTLQPVLQVGDNMDKKKDKLLLLYLFQDTNLKKIDIYTLSKNILKLRHVIEMYTTSEQNKNENIK